MPQPADLLRVSWQFSLGSAEVAQCDVWCQANTPPVTDPDWLNLVSQVATAARDGWKTQVSPSHFGEEVELKRALCARYSSAGHILQELASITAPGDWVGSDDTSMPWSTAICVNLYTYTPGTFIAQNRSRRGRIFLPPPGRDVLQDNASGEMDNAIPPVILSEIRQLFLAVQAAHVTVGVLSTTHNFWNHVTDVTTDTKLDTMRRRAKNEPATVFTLGI